MSRLSRVDWALAVLLLAAALVPRLQGLDRPSLNTDEVKWIRRGERMIHLFREGQYRLATAHVSHPGVPAAAAIGFAMQESAWLGLDPVVAARLPGAIAGALVPPLLYLAAAPLWGREVAALAGAFLAVDPRHLATSRTAHIDPLFAVFYLAALWGFFRHAEADGAVWGVAGGVALGLAELTRTSGVVAVLTWVTFATVLWMRSRRRPVTVAELYFAVIALAVFVALYGKLWLPHGVIPAVNRYPFVPAVEDAIASASAHRAAWLMAATVLAGFAWRLRRTVSGPLCLLCACAFASPALAPDLARNLSGFVMNLATTPHRIHHNYYGGLAPPPGRYLTVLASGMPLVAFLGASIGLPLLALRSWRDRSRTGDAGLLVVSAVVVFLGVVSPLRKVAFRYLMPISPLLALSAAWAWVTVGALLPAAYRRALVAAVAVAAAAVVLPVAPHFAAWTSTIGSLVRREAGIVPLLGADGHDDAALFLWRRAGPGDRVATFCYDDVLRFYWHRVLPARLGEPPKPAPAFGYYRLGDADFVVWARRGPNLPPTLEEFVSHRRPDLEVRALEEVVLRAWDLRAAPAAGRP